MIRVRLAGDDEDYEFDLDEVAGDRASGLLHVPGRVWLSTSVPVGSLKADSAIELDDAIEQARVHPLDRRDWRD